jgi:pimeloyl-ACP methyl ester carboxylesterase
MHARGPFKRAPRVGGASLSRVTSIFTPSHRGGSGSPLVCLHGFTDTWRTWELVLPELERRHDVLAPTLLAHAGGPRLEGPAGDALIVDAVERAMDDAGFEAAHIAGNSLGGYIALQLAARDRARSVVALAPAGGWASDDPWFEESLAFFGTMHEQSKKAAPHADAVVATREGRRRITQYIVTSFEHIPAELLAHQICGAAGCDAMPLIEVARREGYDLDAQKITCPVRIVWGTDDKILPWPSTAVRYRHDWLPHADWVELDGVGHCPQLDVPLETAQLILDFTSR